MIIIEIIGGLGNQMFQYAFKMAYDMANGTRALIDINTFKSYKLRQFQLDVFGIEKCYATTPQIAECRHERRKLRWIFPFRFKHKTICDVTMEKVENIYEPDLLNKTGDVYFRGYFQTDKYFRHIRQDVLNVFKLKKTLDKKNKNMLDEIHNADNSVAVHVRRGDYVALAHIFGGVDADYYRRAMDYMMRTIKDPKFFVFSDDINWCRENLNKDYDMVFVDINNGDTCYFDLELMKNCRHNIIANSSFSWWGAWLNENPNKIVIAPKVWFADGRPTDIVPEEWVRM